MKNKVRKPNKKDSEVADSAISKSESNS